jgi:hypothetical protein
MIDNKGTYRCDAEIGSVKRGWHTCGRKAGVHCERRIAGDTIFLEFCERHRAKATQEGRHSTRELT